MRNKLILWFALLIAGFLVGSIPLYSRSQRLQQELSVSTKQIESCHANEQFSQLRDTASMMYLEAEQKNYGKAGGLSGEFFDQAQRIASSTEDPPLRNLLRDILATRDQITANLAKGDTAALSAIQSVVLNLEQKARPLRALQP
ncbi:MAG: hypothetical protein H0U76_03120 [Ktedonobacteraceae bacterium]|nr:hypothetical protein [Ktedonobacteraceae bacterium]